MITLYEKPQDVNEQSGLNFTWSETPKSDYLLQEKKAAVPLIDHKIIRCVKVIA